jgi:tetratricopeptide (TPR) repeat protein
LILRSGLLLLLGGCVSSSALLRDARLDIGQGQYAEARQKAERAVRQRPHLVEACVLLSQLHYRDRSFDHAVQVIRACGDQQDVLLREQLGLSLYKTEIPAPHEAVEVLEKVVVERPEAVQALLQLATHHAKTSPSRTADLLLQYLAHRSPELASGDDLIRERLVLALLASRRDEEARTQSLLYQRTVAAEIKMAAAYSELKMWSDAWAILDPYLRRTPDDSRAQVLALRIRRHWSPP